MDISWNFCFLCCSSVEKPRSRRITREKRNKNEESCHDSCFKTRNQIILKYLSNYGKVDCNKNETQTLFEDILKYSCGGEKGPSQLQFCACCQKLADQISLLQLELETIGKKLFSILKMAKATVVKKSTQSSKVIDNFVELGEKGESESNESRAKFAEVLFKFHKFVCKNDKLIPFVFLESLDGVNFSEFNVPTLVEAVTESSSPNALSEPETALIANDVENDTTEGVDVMGEVGDDNVHDIDWQYASDYEDSQLKRRESRKRKAKSSKSTPPAKQPKATKKSSGTVKLTASKTASYALPPVQTEAQQLRRELLKLKSKIGRACKSTGKSKTVPSSKKVKKWFKCEGKNCLFTAKHTFEMINHLRKQHETTEKNYECPDCKIGFTQKQYFEIHLQRHDGWWKCDVCEKQVIPVEMKEHLRSHNEKVFECDLCDACFGDYTALLHHTRYHRGVILECELCPDPTVKQYRTINTLLGHLYESHDYSHLILKCEEPDCSKIFFDPIIMKSHKQIHSDRFVCQVCGRRFQNRLSVENHFRSVHANEKLYECDLCLEKFASMNSVQSHKIIVHNLPLLKCELCSREYTSLKGLAEHKQTIHSEAPLPTLKCGICCMEFITMKRLRQHDKTHSDKKDFTCDICGFATRTNALLKNHMLKHDGEKKFQCSYCEKKFAAKKYLRDHVRTHTKEKPFQCEECGTAYNQQGSLNLHKKRTGHGDCDKGDNLNLEVHDTSLVSVEKLALS